MNYEENVRRKIEAGNFAENNGRIIRAINVLAGKWVCLDTVKRALEDTIPAGELEKSMLFLLKAGYLQLRKKSCRQKAEWEDSIQEELEVTLTHNGMKLAMYYITDEAIRV